MSSSISPGNHQEQHIFEGLIPEAVWPAEASLVVRGIGELSQAVTLQFFWPGEEIDRWQRMILERGPGTAWAAGGGRWPREPPPSQRPAALPPRPPAPPPPPAPAPRLGQRPTYPRFWPWEENSRKNNHAPNSRSYPYFNPKQEKNRF